MSQPFPEGRLVFDFPDSWIICRPDETSFYIRHFQSFCGGCKEMDFLGYDPDQKALWLIEVKDYREHQRTKQSELPREVAEKVRDVLAMLPVSGIHDEGISTPEKIQAGDFWLKAVAADKIRVVLHCELPEKQSKMFPGVKDSANLKQKLRTELRSVDPHSLFMNKHIAIGTPWTVSESAR